MLVLPFEDLRPPWRLLSAGVPDDLFPLSLFGAISRSSLSSSLLLASFSGAAPDCRCASAVRLLLYRCNCSSHDRGTTHMEPPVLSLRRSRGPCTPRHPKEPGRSLGFREMPGIFARTYLHEQLPASGCRRSRYDRAIRPVLPRCSLRRHTAARGRSLRSARSVGIGIHQRRWPPA